MSITTIQLDTATRDKMASMKHGDTYDAFLQKLMRLVPDGDDEGKFADAFRMGLLEAKLDAKEGRVVSTEELERRLGL